MSRAACARVLDTRERERERERGESSAARITPDVEVCLPYMLTYAIEGYCLRT